MISKQGYATNLSSSAAAIFSGNSILCVISLNSCCVSTSCTHYTIHTPFSLHHKLLIIWLPSIYINTCQTNLQASSLKLAFKEFINSFATPTKKLPVNPSWGTSQLTDSPSSILHNFELLGLFSGLEYIQFRPLHKNRGMCLHDNLVLTVFESYIQCSSPIILFHYSFKFALDRTSSTFCSELEYLHRQVLSKTNSPSTAFTIT